jgi:membrane protein implicated in regulation of membrane protease activity
VADDGAGGLRPLDEFMPTYEFSERHAISIGAEAADVDLALRGVTFGEVPLMRVLLLLRGIGRPSADETVLAAISRRARTLEDVPGEGIVLSLGGRFWRARGGPADEPPATAVIDFRAWAGRLTTETRVRVDDPRSRRRFARYWRVIRPFSGLTRVLVLRAAKRRAETAP